MTCKTYMIIKKRRLNVKMMYIISNINLNPETKLNRHKNKMKI